MFFYPKSPFRTIEAGSLLTAVAAAGALVAWAPLAHAGDVTSSADGQSRVAAESGYWTAARIKGAQPLDPHPAVAPRNLSGLPHPTVRSGPSYSAEGAPPSVELDAPLNDQLAPPDETPEAAPRADVKPLATSGFGAHFTTYRVFPDAATVAYPNRTAGKLFFEDPRTLKNYVCSASVLRPRIIVTAGHCVTNASTSASGRYFYSHFLFVPAYNNNSAPYGSWTPKQEWVTNAWYQSNGSVPNTQDVAILIANDQKIGNGVNKIGSITGWLGYQTNALSNNNVTMLGYPCNLDSCVRMEATNAQTYESGGNNTYIYGSAMKGGASGGPWIQDYGVTPVGTPAPSSALGLNRLVAVTSYQPLPTNSPLEYLGASNLDNSFLTLLTDACNAGTGNC